MLVLSPILVPMRPTESAAAARKGADELHSGQANRLGQAQRPPSRAMSFGPFQTPKTARRTPDHLGVIPCRA